MRIKGRHILAFIAAIFAIVSTFGCGGGGGSSSDGGGGGTPLLTLSSSSIDFGNLVVGQTADRSVRVQNTGTGNLVIGAITSPAAPFSLVAGQDTCSNQTVAANASCTVVVRFAPPSQQDGFAGSFLIPSNDTDENVTLSGNGKGLNVKISNVSLNGCPNPGTAEVTVTVTDSANDPITGLLQGAFSAIVNNVPATIVPGSFKNTQAESVSVALALDFSNSIVSDFGEKAIKDTAAGFINQLKATDRANVYKFAEKIDSSDSAEDFIFATDPPLDGKSELRFRVDRARDLDGKPTFLFDALDFIIDRTALETNNRRAVILVTDGYDDNDPALITDIIAKANDLGVFIFTIGLGTDVDTVVMQRLAVETGGQYFTAPSQADLTAIYSQISLILVNQYQFQINGPIQGGSLNVEVQSGADQGEDTVIIPGC